MVETIIGGLLFLVAQASKKYNISQTYLIAISIIVLSAIYTFININNPDILNQVKDFAIKTLGTANALWLIYGTYSKTLSNKS